MPSEREDLGKSDLAWLDRNRFGITLGDGGEDVAIRQEVAALESRFIKSKDDRQQEVLRTRIGRLRGGSALVYCGGSSESEMRFKKESIRRTIAALRSALLSGILPGCGTAFLHCIESLQEAHDKSSDIHERAAYGILMTAAAAPCRTLLANAGHEAPGIVLDEILTSKNGAGYDIRTGLMVETIEDGVVDSAAALMAALRNGIGGAALALTVDTIVHRVNPPLAIEPGGMSSSTDMGNIELK